MGSGSPQEEAGKGGVGRALYDWALWRTLLSAPPSTQCHQHACPAMEK